MKRWQIYILELEHDKWYVGVAGDVQKRVYQHARGKAVDWTRKHKPVKLHKVQDLGRVSPRAAYLYERRAIKIYTDKYGKKNVRGGDLELMNRNIKVFGRRFRLTDWETILVLSVVVVGAAYIILDRLNILPW